MPEYRGRPNVLLICTDQQSASALSCAGSPYLATPHLDNLATGGVRFSRAYCTQPLCSPSRASLFTGRMPHEVGVISNDLPLYEDALPHTLGRVVSAAGYECAYAGKWHVLEGAMPDGVHGFRTICGQRDDLVADECSEFLRQDHHQPFFLVASFQNPHDICEWSRDQILPQGDIASTSDIDHCPPLPANYAIPPFEPHVIRQEMRRYPDLFSIGSAGDDIWWRRYRKAYNQLVEKVDIAIGRVLASLTEAGLDESTVVIFTSDHGDMQGAHQMNMKWFLYEEAIHVPLIISDPNGRGPRGVEDTHLVSNGLDIFATICDYTGANLPGGLRGRSLRPLANGKEVKEWRDEVVCEAFMAPPRFIGTQGVAVRTDRYKYTVYNWGRYREQLVDLKADPGEMVNLAVDSYHREILAEHRARFEKWRDDTGYEMRERGLPRYRIHHEAQ